MLNMILFNFISIWLVTLILTHMKCNFMFGLYVRVDDKKFC